MPVPARRAATTSPARGNSIELPRAATAEPRAQKTALLIARRIVSNIERSGLTVGDKLPREKEMLLEYQVSRSTLREALRFLELQGIVALKPGPGGGPVVQRPEPSNLSTLLLLQLQFSDVRFRSVYEARTYLEPIMAGLAAGRMSGRDLEALEASVTDMERHVEDDELFLESNKRFHEIIARSSGNPLFGALVDGVLDIIDGSRLGMEYPLRNRLPLIEAHRRVLAALRRRDARAAEQAMREHILDGLHFTERRFPEVLDRRVAWAG